jgi:hypothetical protein
VRKSWLPPLREHPGVRLAWSQERHQLTSILGRPVVQELREDHVRVSDLDTLAWVIRQTDASSDSSVVALVASTTA